MAAKEVAKDKYICTRGQALEAIHILASGTVEARFPGGVITLKKGDAVGLYDIAFDSHSFTYKTVEDSAFISFPAQNSSSITGVVKVNPEVGKMLYTSMVTQTAAILNGYMKSLERCQGFYNKIKELYNDYVDVCNRSNVISRTLPGLEELSPFEPESVIADWLLAYYASIREFPIELKHSLASRTSFLTGFLFKASEDIHIALSIMEEAHEYISDISALLLQESGLDIYDLYTALLFRLKPGTPEYEKVFSSIEEISTLIKEIPSISNELFEARNSEYTAKLSKLTMSQSDKTTANVISNNDLNNAVDIIMEYADMDEDFKSQFRALLSKYRKLSDRGSQDEGPRKLRLDITQAFYTLYTQAFQMSVRDDNIPVILKMFFNFGFVDAELAGADNANYLFSIADEFAGDESRGVFTAHEWLMAIYNLKREPSRNEFDLDYMESLRERRVQGKIDAETERKLAQDPGERVLFELSNMFPLVNKVTYGRLSTFCPILDEHDMIKAPQSCIITPDVVEDSFKKLEAIDYGAFYRETVFSDDSVGIQKEYLAVRITPDVILCPNVGTRGVMWQEIEGKKRTTPARFIISVFHLEDVSTTLTRLTGEYRWEMCKRVQGARWNDVSERSLTSEYFDYVQFYKKNNDLSPDAKEKVKNSLAKAKNSFKEMFVRDYIVWVMFEGAGSPRLNKVARAILLTYCPFPLSLRGKISANPMFKELIERYEIKTQQKLHHFDNVVTKIKSSGKDVPEELIIHRKYIEGSV